jgi:uncharacterized protein YjbJ (UPF0337 family)
MHFRVKGASTMNKDVVRGQWQEKQGKFKRQWHKLTDDEIFFVEVMRKNIATMMKI